MKKAQLLPSTVQRVSPQPQATPQQPAQPNQTQAPNTRQNRFSQSEIWDSYYLDQNSWIAKYPNRLPNDYLRCKQYFVKSNWMQFIMMKERSNRSGLWNKFKNRLREVR